MRTLAPIVVFVYNRPWHTQQTLEALAKNVLADQSLLYIVSDGIKLDSTLEEVQKIQEVRSLICTQKWCKEVVVIELTENLGVDKNIVQHVTSFVNKHDKLIVLEDDIVTSEGFLTYMNSALEIYKNEDQIFGISAYMFPVKKKMPEIFFLMGGNNPWGWATWKHAWTNFNPDYNQLYDSIANNKDRILRFNHGGSADYLSMLKNCTEANAPWDIRWYASVFLRNGYGLWAGSSMVQNIGHDGTGAHGDLSKKYHIRRLNPHTKVDKQTIVQNEEAYKALLDFYHSFGQQSILRRIINKIKRLFLSRENT